ncbi:MAG: hypothetical protein EA340_11135 [Nitriliruptor sp.]|nr:MAG: hypothetical protein EA340_11135 [Nitriliruptor sp.]TVR19947.1 MAG: hypothetical protein EA387_12455 [Nitriliruptor sp.]
MFGFAARRDARAARSGSRSTEHSDRGQQLRRVLIAWFCLWLAIILLAWHTVETGGGPEAELSGWPSERSGALR